MSIASFTVGCCLNSPLQFTSAGSSHYQLCLTPRKGFTDHPPSWLESGLCSLVFQHHSYLLFHYSHGDLMGGEFTMLTITASSWIKALEYHLMLFDMINNKWHFFFFFFSFIRILDLEVEQNQAQEETLPSWLLCSSLAFSSGLLPSPLSLLTASLLSKAQRVSESMMTSWNHELCHGKEVGNESSWQSRACCWQKYPASGHRPRMSLRDVAKVRVAHPSLPSNEFVTRDGRRKWGWSGNEPWLRPRPAGQLTPPRGPVPPGLFDQGPSWHKEMLSTWLVRTVAALSGVLGKHAVR